MSNVVQLTFPSRAESRGARIAALLDCFAEDRRVMEDVFWLKENAELLNILECTSSGAGTRPEAAALSVHGEFYDRIERRLGFFPQYYRFLLSICLDLEDLGFGGDKGERLVNWVADQGLAEAELSDLQRAEARRLMLRRGRDPMAGDPGLDDRLRAFTERSATFAMPNKKAAYELTHIVFYLSEYGRRDPELTDATKNSLIFAGTLGYLDQNADLLAEICVAMRYAGFPPPHAWEDWLIRHMAGFAVAAGDEAMVRDDYHEFLVGNWALSLAGADTFRAAIVPDRMSFHRPALTGGPLREMSECLFRLEDGRTADWTRMRDVVCRDLTGDARQTLAEAEAACDDFDAFFAGFARPGLQSGPTLQGVRT